MNGRKLAALFIDFENFYYSLTNLYEMPYEDAGEEAVALIAYYLDESRAIHGEFIIRQAFADWSSKDYPKKELQRLGIRIVDILSTAYKNSADIELSLSVQETIITREDIDTIVIFAGDRDYLPIANRAREKGKNLHFVGFEKSLSGDLKYLIGESNYSYVKPENYSGYGKHEKGFINPKGTKQPVSIEELTPDQIKASIAAIESFDEYKGKFGSVKVSIFLVEGLARSLPDLEHLARKKVFRTIEEAGIILIEKKKPEFPDSYGNLFPFTVFTVNENSKIVKALRSNRTDSVVDARALLLNASKSVAEPDNTVLGARLGIKLREINPGFLPAKYGFTDLADYVEHYPDILIYEGEKQGGDRVYRFVKGDS
ncbi:MAG: NYN domain-containing protein [Thermoplasmataceae archaeon]